MALHYDYVMIIIITMLLHRRELAKAIADCRQAVHNAHKAALKARQRFDNAGLQGTLVEHRAEVEKDKLT